MFYINSLEASGNFRDFPERFPGRCSNQKTWQHYAYVARNVEKSIRMDILGWSHHQKVNAVQFCVCVRLLESR